MARWSFGLRQLFLWTAAISLGLVALRSASATWVGAMLGLTFATLTASILFAVFRKGQQKAFWIGFATFGWAYLLLLLVSWTLGRNTVNNSPLRAQNLPTQQMAGATYHWLYDEAFEKYNAGTPNGGYYGPMAGGGYVGSGMMVDSGDSGLGYEGDMIGGVPMGPGMAGGLGVPAIPAGPPPGPNESDFVKVAHALWTLLFAVIGGSLAHSLYVTGPGRTEREASVSS